MTKPSEDKVLDNKVSIGQKVQITNCQKDKLSMTKCPEDKVLLRVQKIFDLWTKNVLDPSV